MSPAEVHKVEKNDPTFSAAALLTEQQTTQNKPVTDEPRFNITELAVATHS